MSSGSRARESLCSIVESFRTGVGDAKAVFKGGKLGWDCVVLMVVGAVW